MNLFFIRKVTKIYVVYTRKLRLLLIMSLTFDRVLLWEKKKKKTIKQIHQKVSKL